MFDFCVEFCLAAFFPVFVVIGGFLYGPAYLVNPSLYCPGPGTNELPPTP